MKLNEAALAALLEAEDGPVGQHVRETAEEIVNVARGNAERIMHRYPVAAEAVDYEIRTGPHGPEAVVGIRDEGRISRYLAAKEQREGVILRAALEQVFTE